MGVLNDFLGILKDFNHVGDDIMEDTFNRKRYSSISKRALEGTLQFPTIVSRSIDIDTLQMITKALEKQFASFAQTSITMSPFLNLNKDKDAAGYLRKFHQNSTKGNLRDDVLNIIAYTDVNESFTAFVSDKEDVVLLTAVGEGSTPKVVKTNKDGLKIILEGIREDALNNKFVPRKALRTKDDYLRRKHGAVFEAKGGGTTIHNNFNNPGTGSFGGNSKQVQGDDIRDSEIYQSGSTSQRGNFNTDAKGADLSHKFKGDQNIATQNVTYNVRGGKGTNVPGMATNVDHKLPNRVLVDNDVKKANELVPTSMHVRVTLMNNDGSVQGNMDFIAGIKATMHPVASDDLVNNVVDAIKNRGKLFKLIRWTTGEIQFARDYVLGLSEIKEDVARTRNKDSRWWTALKRRRKLANFKKNIFLPGDILPNASIVLSVEEAEYIKQEFGYDLLDTRVADKIMREYFLISITIVDSAAQIAHFLFDGYEDYQTVTFSGLERGDLNGGGVDFKDVLKLVQRV